MSDAASMKQDQVNIRALAAQTIVCVMQGSLLDKALDRAMVALSPDQRHDRSLLKELCYGTLRWWYRLDGVTKVLLERPMKQKDHDIFALLQLGLYQLLYMRVPSHAAVSETVAAVNSLRKPWAKNLINACLRAYLRNPESVQTAINRDPVSAYGHPDWLLTELQQAWPQRWQDIIHANNQRPPMSLRVNLGKISRSDYLAMLTSHRMNARPTTATDCGVVLEQPVTVAELPGFADGLVSVQDVAAQLASVLLDIKPGQRVLDACAAPGGKTAHILERYPEIGSLAAIDVEPARLKLIEQNLQRLDLHATVLQGDATNPKQWWDGKPFQRILLDAPCSATGVIRRHPDIKLHRNPDEIRRLVDIQAQILDWLWPLLESGGKLLYATCSILPGENDEQIQAFVARQQDARYVALATGQSTSVPLKTKGAMGWQIFPGEGEMDGFYYAYLQKN